MGEDALRSEAEVGFYRRKGDGFSDGDDSFPYGVTGITFAVDLDESLLEVYGIGMKLGDLFAVSAERGGRAQPPLASNL